MDNWTHSLVCPTVLKEVVQLVILVQLLLTIRPLLKLLFLLVLLNAGWQLRMLFGTFLPVHMLNLQRSLLRSLENTDIYTCTGKFIQWHGQGHIYIDRYINTFTGTYVHVHGTYVHVKNIYTYIHLQEHIYMYRYIYTCSGIYIHVQVHI